MTRRTRPLAARHYQRKDSQVRLLADHARPAIARDFKGAIKHLSSVVPTDKVMHLARAGEWHQILQVIAWGHFKEVLKAPLTRLTKLSHAGAALGVQKINGSFGQARRAVRFRKGITSNALLDLRELFDKDIGDRFNFDISDQKTLDRIRRDQDELIAQLDDQARDTVETIIVTGLKQGLGPADIVGDIRDMIGLTEQQALAVMNYENMLRDLNPGALDRKLRNTENDAAVQDAIDSGQDLPDSAVARMSADYLENYLSYRAATIAQTESVRAVNAGIHDAYKQAISRGALPHNAVRRYWQVALDERTCFPTGTRIATPYGQVAINQLTADDIVLTRKGKRQLRAVSWQVTMKTIVVLRGFEFALALTCDHRVMCGGQWMEAREVEPGDILHGGDNQPIKVLAVAHIELADPHGAPAKIEQRPVSLDVLRRIAMPKRAVNLDCDLVFGQREVDQISPNSVFLLKRNPAGQGNANGSLWQCFAIKAAVASERAKLSGRGARQLPEAFAAVSTFRNDWWPTARLRTMLAPAFAVAHENSATFVACDSHCVGQSTFTRANIVAVGVGRRHAERLAAGFTNLFDLVPVYRIVAFAGTELAAAAGAALRGVKRLAASRAWYRAPFEGARLHVATLAFLGHDGMDLDLGFIGEIERNNRVVVHDLQVDGEPEFFANGLLVHNCEICLSIPDMNPDGVGVDEPFESIDGPMDDPPDPHPACRCSVDVITDLSKVPDDFEF